MNRVFLLKRATPIAIIAIVSIFLVLSRNSEVNFKQLEVYSGSFFSPTQVVHSNHGWLLAQAYTKTVSKTDSLEHQAQPLFENKKLNSPHFIATTDNGLFVSEGWGKQVQFFDFKKGLLDPPITQDLDLNGPHGICVDHIGWLYIADSINSRLLRVHTQTGESQVFKDHQKKIAYGRQLLCEKNEVWLSNSYENKFQLNPGKGSNVLKISDFESGNVEVVVEYPDTNMTGIQVINNSKLLIGRWSGKYDIVIYDLKTRKEQGKLYTYDKLLGAPYGMSKDSKNRKLYIAFLGSLDKSKKHQGGIIEYSY